MAWGLTIQWLVNRTNTGSCQGTSASTTTSTMCKEWSTREWRSNRQQRFAFHFLHLIWFCWLARISSHRDVRLLLTKEAAVFFFPSFSSWLLWNHELPATSRYQEIMKKSSPSSGNKPPTAVEQSTRPITCARKFSCYSTTTTNFRRQEYLWNGLTRQQTASRLHFDWLAYWWLLQSLQLP